MFDYRKLEGTVPASAPGDVLMAKKGKSSTKPHKRGKGGDTGAATYLIMFPLGVLRVGIGVVVAGFVLVFAVVLVVSALGLVIADPLVTFFELYSFMVGSSNTTAALLLAAVVSVMLSAIQMFELFIINMRLVKREFTVRAMSISFLALALIDALLNVTLYPLAMTGKPAVLTPRVLELMGYSSMWEYSIIPYFVTAMAVAMDFIGEFLVVTIALKGTDIIRMSESLLRYAQKTLDTGIKLMQ